MLANKKIFTSLTVPSVGETEETGTQEHCWWACDVGQPIGSGYWQYLTNLCMYLPFHPAIPLLEMYSKYIPLAI